MRQTPNATDTPINVVGASTFGRYSKISGEKTYNMFISDEWLVNFAGFQKILNLGLEGAVEGRGSFHSVRGNILIIVVSNQVYSIDANLVATFVGKIQTFSGDVTIDENLNSQIGIVDGNNFYIYNYSIPVPNLVLQTVSPDLTPNYITFHNTYFILGNANSTAAGSAWYGFSFSTPTTVTPSFVLALQTKPDYAVAVTRLPGQANNILVIGTSVCEIWTNVQGLQFYRRNSTVNIDYGCVSVGTISNSDKYVAWLAVNENNAPTIMVYSGQGAAPISTDGIDYALSKIQFPAESTGMFFRQDGHLFYQLTFFNPADNLTLVYDFTTQKFFHLSDQNLDHHPARNYIYFDNNLYFISLNNACLYQSSTDITTYNESIGNVDPTQIFDIQRIRTCENIRNADSTRFIANSLVITIEQGQDQEVSGISLLNNEDFIIDEDSYPGWDDPLITEFGIPIITELSGAGIGQGELPPPYRPRVDLSVSYDGGVTWSNTVSRGLNPVANRKNILTWEKIGQANDLVLKFRFWGRSRFVVSNGSLQIYT
jgi:hypothetical protein